MRFLKNKILRAQQLTKSYNSFASNQTPNLEANTQDIEVKGNEENRNKVMKRNPLGPQSRNRASTKNIAINFGRAIASFTTSHLALPYLKDHLEKEKSEISGFYNFIKAKKATIQGIIGFRSLLVSEKDDNPEILAYKELFRWLGEVFLKCFSVNWITHGKVSHKLVYLKFRSKMLRRIQHPELFTYLKKRPDPK